MPHTARHGSDDDGSWAGNEDGETADGGGDGGGGTGGGGGDSAVWGAIAPDFLTDNGGLLRAFLNNPRGFVLGAVLTTILETVTGVVTTVFDQLVLLAGGSQPTQFNAPGEQLGLADVPVAIADTLIGAGGFSGDAIIAGIETFNGQIADAAAAVGPFGPLVLIVLISVEAIVAAMILRRIVFVVADWLQLGGLTE
jgi:hypothetical protein